MDLSKENILILQCQISIKKKIPMKKYLNGECAVFLCGFKAYDHKKIMFIMLDEIFSFLKCPVRSRPWKMH